MSRPKPPPHGGTDKWMVYYRELDDWVDDLETNIKLMQAMRPVMLDVPPDKEMPDRAIYAEGENYEGFDIDVVYWYEGLENFLEEIVPSTRLADAEREWKEEHGS